MLLTTKEIALKWGVSVTWVTVLCKKGRIEGAIREGNRWYIPEDAKKPEDKRSCKNAPANDYHGWLSKTFLNYYGIDTEKENKGIYADRSVPDVVDELYKSSNIAHVRVAKLLKEKYL